MKTQKNTLSVFLRTFTFIFSILIVSSFVSCEGPAGPAGYDGQDGQDGGLVYTDVYKLEGDFTSANKYKLGFTFSGDGLYEGDVVLVYILWKTVDNTDIWRLLPQTVVLENETIIYNYDFTYGDVQVFIEYTGDYDNLLPAETENQTFKVVVVPGNDYAKLKSTDISDLNALLSNSQIKVNIIDDVEFSIN